MLGKYLRLKIAIVLAVLGLVVLGLGIGQRTIWLPPATLTASVPADVAAAPLTVVGPELLKTRDGKFTLTIKNDGPIQLAVARERDITGWIGDAAHTTLGAPDADFTALTAESVKGTESVPDPAGSDLWVSEEKATGEMTYTWQAPGHGDWALLLSSDGKAAAPSNIAITVDNEAGTPWAVPLMVIGSALLALAALLFLLAPRTPKGAEAAVGRRAAGRVPADPATGALEVEKIVAARRSAAVAAPATIAEAGKAGRAAKSGKDDTDAPATAAIPTDAASALPSSLRGNEPAGTQEPIVVGKTSADAPVGAGEATKDSAAESAKGKDSGKDDGPDAGSGGGGSAAAKDSGAKNADSAKDAKPSGSNPKDGGKNTMGRLRWGAAVAAVLMAGSVGPAMAADETASPSAPAPSSSASAEASAAATAVTAAPGFPNLLDSQVERIAASLATVVASGDNAKDAKALEPRVAGMALEMRTANYKIRAKVSSQAAPEPVNGSPLLAKVVSTTEAWPRTAMFVTQGENNTLPQLLTLVQASARENYKLTNATPLLPGQTFPSVDKEGSAEVPLDSATGLLMSPKAAIAALSDRLTKEDSKFKGSFNDSVYVTSVFDLQKKVSEGAKDASYVFSHAGNLDTAVSLRTADGGAMVIVGNTFGIDASSKENATLTVGEDAAVFTGGRETTTGFKLNYAEPVVMYIPPTADGKITILSATRALVGGSFK